MESGSRSRILGDVVLKKLDGRNWEVYQPLEYRVGGPESNEVIVVPKGFITDLASVPRVFWVIYPPDGTYTNAAVVHDFLYSVVGVRGRYTRKQCDNIFLEAMKVVGVPAWRRWILYSAVRIGGSIAWRASLKKL